MAVLAEALLAETDAIAAEMDAAILRATPALGADAALVADVQASTKANLARWLTATARHPGAAVPGDVTPEALDMARTLVRRGLETDLLVQSYRTGQNVAWTWALRTVLERVPAAEQPEVLQRAWAQMTQWVDAIIDGVVAAARREREELVGGQLSRRAETIRLLLDGAPLDVDVAAQRLGYELRRPHVAAVLWADPPRDEQGALETAASALARAAGAARPLLHPAGTSTLWAWFSPAGAPNVAPDTLDVRDPGEALRAALAGSPPHVRAAVGPARTGATGFRRTHAGALSAQRLAAAVPGGPRVTTYAEVEVVALAGGDVPAAAEFVRSVLGDLAAGDATADRLRETVRTFLAEGEHGPRTAERLGTHRNTILHRIGRAEELLGHPIADRRLAVALALELAHRLGAQVLRP